MKYERDTFVCSAGDKAVEVKVASAVFDVKGKVAEYHLFFTVGPTEGSFTEQLAAVKQGVGKTLKEKGWGEESVVFKRYFLSDVVNQDGILRAQEEKRNVSVVQQAPANGSKLALWVYGQSGRGKNNPYRHLWMAGGVNPRGDAEQQTRELLESYDTALLSERCRMATDCIRTWFFVRDIDVNYAGVVKGRRELFREWGLTEKTHYIASTGIEGRVAEPQCKVLFEAYAVKGLKPEQVRYLQALTHLNPTWEYGVTFERGVSVLYGDRRQAYISGTASIDAGGSIVGEGDVTGQVARMWENVAALLEEGGYGFEDVAHMIVYIRDAGDYRVVNRLFEERFPEVPKVIVVAAVCRPGWLVEMECIALKEQVCTEFDNF